MIQEGQPAPLFTLNDASGKPWTLEALRASGPVVLFFYPRDESAICTREVCAFRDAHQDFADAGAAVVGISSDGEGSHDSFARKQRLNYLLLSDPGGKVRRAYGIPKTLGVVDGRATFVIDRSGVVRWHTRRSWSLRDTPAARWRRSARFWGLQETLHPPRADAACRPRSCLPPAGFGVSPVLPLEVSGTLARSRCLAPWCQVRLT